MQYVKLKTLYAYVQYAAENIFEAIKMILV